jgi:1-acyl-sn-glycerol-3-phosphate acyltransferase
MLQKYNIVFVVKKELSRLPFWGWVLLKTGSISIDRSGGMKELTKMVQQAQNRLNNDHSIIIFPEGTRKKVGAEPDYKKGIALMYSKLNVPVVPIAVNSGLIMPKKSFWVHKGHLVIKALPEIKPGIRSKDFMAQLQNTIEEETNKLCKNKQ